MEYAFDTACRLRLQPAFLDPDGHPAIGSLCRSNVGQPDRCMNRSNRSTDRVWTPRTRAARTSKLAPPQTDEHPVSPRTHVLTVALEDYFHAAPFRPWIREETWYRFEDRLGQSTGRALDLLDRCSARATFFVSRRTAQSAGDLVREIVARGHEIASRGEHTGAVRDLSPDRLREDAIGCREYLQDLTGRRVVGYRMASPWLEPEDLWVLDVLADCGYLYDSSIRPTLGTNAADVWLRSRRRTLVNRRTFREVPVSSLPLMGLQVPIAGGGSLRHIPEPLLRRAIAHWDQRRSDPYVLYFRPWELDPEQPRISAGPVTTRIRHYRNLERMPGLLEELLTSYRFGTVASHLDIDLALPHGFRPTTELSGTVSSATREAVQPERAAGSTLAGSSTAEPTPVTIVVPCFNETHSLRYLNNTLQSVASALRDRYTFSFVFVDDRSTDETWAMLQDLFGSRADCVLVRHEQNQGVAGTIQTGIRHAETEIVCSIDCDCTYDPHELGRMIPLLIDGVDLVTASPYHPAGKVRNLTKGRLFLSKTLSQLYRLVLHQKLATYTSCFRVYRRQSASTFQLRNQGFLGIAELLAQVDFSGRRIVEFPTTLEVRVLGQSKMKILRTIAGHLRLLTYLARLRLTRRAGSLSAGAAT
jgi:polysaccharide deacetylase family protein (PEP-CTERM system associated)